MQRDNYSLYEAMSASKARAFSMERRRTEANPFEEME